MANVSKDYAVGGTVWVWYHDSITLQYTPISKVVSKVNVDSSTNNATVDFTSGNSVIDGATARVFTTQELCAVAIVDAVITATAAAVALDTGTTSVASTASQSSTTLGRVS